MNLIVSQTAEEMSAKAAKKATEYLAKAIEEKGKARIVLSTGASQFEVLSCLVKEPLNWSAVEMFHLDEYVGLPGTHPASFQHYLEERFTGIVHPQKAFYVDGMGDVQENLKALNEEIRREPIDLALIGIGENAHIAFNDPPADFDTQEPFIVVDMKNEECRKQQVGEGWFQNIDEVPKKAITMTVYQIMQAKAIISCVGGKRKAQAVFSTVNSEVSPMVPATKLKEHPDWTLYVDKESAACL